MRNETMPLLEVENLKMSFTSGKRGKKVTVNAIDDNSFKIYEGETFGLVGESGCGKTTTGRTIIRLYNPTEGVMRFQGKEISGPMTKELRHFLTDNIAMIFQDPIDSLNPRMTVEEIIGEGLKYRGMKNPEERREIVYDMLNKVGLTHEHASRYPHEFSGGQRQRIGIARALVVKPKLIIADEPVSALDVSVQAQVINLLNDLKEELGLTIMFVAHDLSVVKYFSTRVAVMYYGKIVEMAPSEELYRHPLHPYTRALLSAVPQPNPLLEKTRQRITYDKVRDHIEMDEPRMMREILPEHFVYCNSKEFERYQSML
ncbi:MAG: ATP-binding cassette domain-containing protein [Lachnospiraceae bacterium]|nr:ATP-binding cassette domain-containing protein [Lachnospiraceae bacterium]